MRARDSKRKSTTHWDYLASESDKGIDLFDIPRLGPDFWRRAGLRMPRKKESVTLQLDHEVLSWFRGLGRGYQTRINAALRSYVKAATKTQS